MIEPAARVWKKVAVFAGLTLLLSSVFYALVISARSILAGHLLYATGWMWCPGLAALTTKAIFREDARDLGWGWRPARYQLWSCLIPILYVIPVYAVVWLTGLGGFYNSEFVDGVAKDFGWPGLSPVLVLTFYVLLRGTVGLIPNLALALGEEIGWRGFLVPELANVVSFPRVALISGLMWAAWHYPIVLFADLGGGTPAWYALTCMTVMAVALSFIMTWLRLRSGSLWTAAILHASHNNLIQTIFSPVTVDKGITKYLIGEFGAGLAITTSIGAVIAWRMSARGVFPTCPREGVPSKALQPTAVANPVSEEPKSL